jgi:hypothetical protein
MTSPEDRQARAGQTIRDLIERDYQRAAARVLQAITRSVRTGRIQQRLDELEAEIARLEADDQRLQRDNPVLAALLNDVQRELERNAGRIDGVAPDLQELAADVAGTNQQQLALASLSDEIAAQVGWNRPDPAAIAQAIDYVSGEAWRDELGENYTGSIMDALDNIVRGLARGVSPTKMALDLSNTIENLPLYQANNLMKTLFMTSYRDSTALHQTANVRIIERVVRVGALDERICLACIAQHGDVVWREGDAMPVPRIQEHHSGRCTTVVQVRGRELAITDGAEWFAGLSEDRQRQQASFIRTPAKYEAYRDGRVSLRDFVQPYDDRVFGEMAREASLKGILGDGAQGYYLR